jgi:ribulose-bisphosphate carboxylase large chain
MRRERHGFGAGLPHASLRGATLSRDAVFSPGHTIRQAAATFTGIHSVNLIYAAGGIMGHPDGVASGVAALRQAWEAAAVGVPLAKAAETSFALSHAMEAYA